MSTSTPSSGLRPPRVRKTSLAALFWFLLCIAVRAQDIPQTGRASASLKAFDDLMRQALQEHHCPGASLVLLKDGRLVLARGYGWADEEHHQLVKPTTGFGLASVSKSLTATAILRLVEQGRLKLDEPMLPYIESDVRILGKLDPRMKTITIRQLLNHTSGLPRNAAGNQRGDANSVVSAGLNQALLFDPGTKASYCNVGYNILGHIIARVSGQPYDAYMQSQVFEPLGMHPRLPGDETTYAPDEAHRFDPNGHQRAPRLRPSSSPAGGWCCSALDLGRFLRALSSHKLLTAPLEEEMFRKPSYARPRNYFGLGWDSVSRVGGGYSYTKNGYLAGVHSQIGHDASSGVDYVLLFNGGDEGIPGVVVTQVIKQIGQTAEWPAEDIFPSVR